MLVLNANQEQTDIFNRLIQVMGAQVVWNGHFIVMGDRLVLEGVVRSLIMHFDIQKVEMELVDLDYDEDDRELEISEYPELQDLITIAIYAFEKWGELQWVSVKQDIAQLNQVFGEILQRYQVAVLFEKDNIQFFREGIRITYEDVIETAVAFEKNVRQTPDSQEKWKGIKLKMPAVGQYQKKARSAAGTQAVLENKAGSDGQVRKETATDRIEKYHARIHVLDRLSDLQRKALQRDIRGDRLLNDQEKEELLYPIKEYESQLGIKESGAAVGGQAVSETKAVSNGQAAGEKAVSDSQVRDENAVADRIEKYHARIHVLDRLSDLQKKALQRDIRSDRLLNEQEKEELLYPIEEYEFQFRIQAIDQEFSDSKNQTYAYIQKVIKKVEQEELSENTKTAVLKKLHMLGIQFGTQEVRKIMEKVPKHVERDEYQELMDKLAPYEEIDFSPYREMLRKMRETLEIKEISNILVQSRKETRADFVSLLRQIGERDFAEENAVPYIERILEWIREIDEKRLNKLLANVTAMNFDTAAAAYAAIKRESFLPALREHASAILSKHLTGLRMAECRMLTDRLKQDIAGVIKENQRHHLYPVEKIIQNAADPEEIRIIETALASYAEEREPFEYPIIIVDTSKECNGRDGMLLTRKHLFYSTRLNGYKIHISAIKSIQASSGLLNRRLILEEANGVRHKLPYAAEANEMQEWATALEKFVRYLQAKPESDVLAELTQELQDAEYCSRCGCMYHSQDTCPECGYSGSV